MPTSTGKTPSFPRSSWLWLVVVLGVASMHFWFPNFSPGSDYDSYSTKAEGKLAFYRLLREEGEKLGWKVKRSFSSLTKREQSTGFARGSLLALLGPGRELTADEWDALLTWIRQGGTLLVAARDDSPGLSIPGLDMHVRPLEDATAADRYEDTTGVVHTSLIEFGDLYWESSAFVDAPNSQALIEYSGYKQAVVQEVGRGQVILVATDFLFWNQSLAWDDNPILAFAVLKTDRHDYNAVNSHPIKRVMLDESLNASSTPKVVGLLLEPPLRSVTIQVFVLVLLFAWWRNRRFGPIEPEASAVRRNLVDHTDTVGSHAWKARSSGRMVEAYLSHLRQELKLGTMHGHEDRVLEPIARRLNRPVSKVQRLLEQAEKATQMPKLPRKTAAEVIRRLAMIHRASRPQVGSPDGE
ncbi:DUF4350 domain-containing protein [Thalassoroseus pseudoceratinae]|uniref:DUF4350 domain-containing protein n=1 Tax=Thalassoroseus pseudoceratinae TaxID=2713176 RepID=UPI00141E0494|nr:DUF4350 domain-containing protein [Thalassoroseus pseudoceratinae]